MSVEFRFLAEKELLKERKILDHLFKEQKYDEIARTKGISVQEKLTKYSRIDSFAYALGKFENSAVLAARIHKSEEITNPNPGDLVLYFNEYGTLPDIATHFGIYLWDNVVVSKWGFGHVYKHPLFLVPLQFGDKVEFRRKP